MEFLTASIQWTLRHPWLMLGALVALGCAVRWTGRSGKRSRAKHGAAGLLRSRKEQQRFSPLSTVYAPKGYRRQRPPRS
ncbi:MAG: hypothetical protein RR857_04080 [Comamonas sp.]|uniref:hypothetical protein n=1 Tax=Comamonas sp. TaxID=34028 RepID=UPI002FC8ED8B